MTNTNPGPAPGWAPKSAQLHAEAQNHMPGGVSSPVRSFRSVGGHPFYVAKGAGSRVWDVDGNEYIDYLLSWGPLVAGHAHPDVVHAITETAQNGTSFGASTELETKLAKRVKQAMPSIALIRFVNSGTEATMSAIRLARAYTGREKIVKFAGSYHGHSDALLVQTGSGMLAMGQPSSPGVPAQATEHTIVLPYNDAAAAAAAFAQHGDQIAGVIVEPVAGNMGFVRPRDDFLPTLRTLTEQHGAVLIFDEVMTGFRISPGGAQEKFGITPDLTCLGKAIGGGLPVGAYGGRRDIMSMVAPSGPMYQAGTLSGNPLAMAAGLSTIELVLDPETFARVEQLQQKLASGLAERAAAAGITVQTDGLGSMFGLYFAPEPVTGLETAQQSDLAQYSRWFWAMLAEGVSFAPSQYEAGFLSIAHTDDDVDKTLAAAEKVFRTL